MSKDLQLTPPPNGTEATGLMAVAERLAAMPDLPVEKLRELLSMQMQIRSIEAKEAYAAALARLQPKLPDIKERGEVTGRYRYALWEDIVRIVTPILSEEGFSLSFRTESKDNSVTVTGVLMHSAGHSETTTLTLPLDTSGNKPSVQAIGSSTSYGKRYTAGALLNLRTGEPDTDGIPPRDTGPKVSEDQIANIETLVQDAGKTMEALCKRLQLKKIEDLPQSEYEEVVALVQRSIKK